MREFETVRAEVLALFPRVGEIARRRSADQALARLVQGYQRLRDGRLTVVVCGEFKRGKSSLLNALLDDTEGLFPVDTTYATRLVTTVRHGVKERVVVTLDDERGGVREREIRRSEIADYATEAGNPHNVRRARLVAVELPHPGLKDGLMLVDTPGVGGVYAEHTEATAAFVPLADVLLFVTDATRPLTESELDFLRGAAESARLTGEDDGQLFALTKIDLVADYTGIMANTRAKLAEVTGRPQDRTEIVPVSSLSKDDYLRDGDPEDLEMSNFPALQQALWEMLGRRRTRALLSGALHDLEQTTKALLAPIEAEALALTERTRKELDQLAAEARERHEHLNGLRQGQAQWRSDLQRCFASLGRELHGTAGEGLDRVWNQCTVDYLERETYLNDPDQLVTQISADVATVTAGLNQLAQREAARILREFSDSSELDLGHHHVAELPDAPLPAIQVTAELGAGGRPSSTTQMVRGTGSTMGIGASVGGTVGGGIGAVIGSVFFPVAGTAAGAQIGAWLGSALGGLFGARAGYANTLAEIRHRDRQQRRTSIQSSIASLRTSQQRHLNDQINSLVAELTHTVVAELDSRIAQELEAANDSVRRLNEARTATAEEATRRAGELRQERLPLDALLALVRRLQSELVATGSNSARLPSGHKGTAAVAGSDDPAPVR